MGFFIVENDRSCLLPMRFPTLEMYLALRHKMLHPEIVGTGEMDKRDTKDNPVYWTTRTVKQKRKQH